MKKLIIACILLSGCVFRAPSEFGADEFQTKTIQTTGNAQQKMLQSFIFCGADYGEPKCVADRCDIFMASNNAGNRPYFGYVQFSPNQADMHLVKTFASNGKFFRAWESYILDEKTCP